MTDLVSLGSVGTPLTVPQRAMWATQRRHRTSPLLNMAILTHLDGEIDGDRLIDSFDAVVAKNRVLSHVVEERSGGPVWVRTRHNAPTTELIHLDRDETMGWATARAAVAIDPRKGTFDSVVVMHDDRTCSWYLDLHHLATDASSSALVFSLTAQEYAARSGVASSTRHDVSPGAYFEWSTNSAAAKSERLDKSRRFWASKTSVEPLGRLYNTASDLGAEPLATRHEVDADLVVPDYAASISEQMSWTTLLATAAAILLVRVTQADAFTIGIPLHHRRTSEAKTLVGPLMEIAPVSLTIDPSMTIAATHAYVGSEVLAALGNAHPGQTPAVEVDAVVNVIPHADFGNFAGVTANPKWIHSGAIEPSNLFRLQLTPYNAHGLNLIFDLNDSVAPPDSPLAATHMSAVLNSVLTTPSLRVNDINLMSASEAAALEGWGRAAPITDAELLVPRLHSALAKSDSIAINDGEASLSGRELWMAASAMAEQFAKVGIAPSSRVGIELGRSADAVVAMLATMFCGASYVPIDPTQPKPRRQRLQERADVVLTVDHTSIGKYRGNAAQPFEPDVESTPSGQDEAYLLFTSGSTGEPKGVPITHRGLADYVEYAVAEYFTGIAGVVAPLFSALTFDLTVTTLFAPLVAGGTVAIVRSDGTDGLIELANRRDITWMKATPSHLELLCRLNPKSDIKTFVVGGEQFTAALARTIWSTFGTDTRLLNEYGPTEAVVGCMIHEAALSDIGRSVPIGHPIDGVSLRIVDDSLTSMPTGAPGELLVSHRGVSSGYIDAEHDGGRFVELDGRRWYRTGDLVRLIDSDTAIYLGRIDEQMKVGGVRLEPSEIEAALLEHPCVEAAAVRLWSPERGSADKHCLVCGLPSNVPAADIDGDGICSTCRSFDAVAEQTASYFGNLDDLSERLTSARSRRTGDFDVLHMLSGGKDSTFALHKLVELGFRPYVLTLDNGFISQGALDNARRSIDSLGIDGEIVTSEVMNDVFRTSLDRYSNVCHGCYKALYTFASQRAADLGIPVIMTGLSRGQLFETRLAPQQFEAGHFDPDAIDTAIIAARRSYHRVDDSVNRLLDTSVFDDDQFFDQVEFVDFYRYADIPLSEMFEFLDNSTPWSRPPDTGRSTNCLVNAAGIYTHQLEQGYHNYAIPYAWDVRLGHKTRVEAMEELDDELDLTDVSKMLAEIGYEPHVRKTLTAWIVSSSEEVAAGELRRFVSDRLQAAAVPSAYVDVDVLPMTTNGKLDVSALPAPARVVRSSALHVAPSSPVERTIASVYERILQVEPVSADDDFFELGGDSLAALDLASILREELSPSLTDEMVFAFTTPSALAEVVDPDDDTSDGPTTLEQRASGAPPPLAAGESALLYEHLNDPHSTKYLVARQYSIPGPVDLARLAESTRAVAERHVSFSWSFSVPRTQIDPTRLVEHDVADEVVSADDFDRLATSAHQRPFDLEAGPLLRLVARPLNDDSTAVCLVMHHLSIDAGTFDVLWSQIDAEYQGLATAVDVDGPDHGDLAKWQEANVSAADHAFWEEMLAEPSSNVVLGRRNARDGLAERSLSVDADELAIGGATPFAVVMAAVAIALRRRSDGSRVGIGVTASTKNHTSAEHIVGYDLNTLPLIIDVDQADTTIDVVRRAAGVLASALPHRTTPLSAIVAKRRDAGLAAPDISVMIAFERFAPAFLGGVEASHIVRWSGESIFDATFFAQVRGNNVDLSLEYSGQVLDANGAQLLLDDVDFILTSVVSRPQSSVSSLELPSAADSLRLSESVIAPSGPKNNSTLISLIDSAMPADTADAAVCNGADRLSWRDLEARSIAIGSALNQRGVGRGHMVAVDVVRDVSTVALIVGILRSGAAYVPLDLSYPEAHINHVLNDAKVDLLLTARPQTVTDHLLAPLKVQILGTRDLAESFPTTAAGNSATPPHIDGDDPAYVIYTSGSAGKPKGVVVSHANIAYATEARRHSYPEPPTSFLMVSSMSFDSSMVGLWWPLTSGSTVVLPEEDKRDDVTHFADLIGRHSVSHTLMLPSLYDVLLDVAQSEQLATLTTVVVAGEVCPLGLIHRHYSLLGETTLVNEYGPTETTVWSHRAVLTPDSTDVPIGELITGANARIVAPDGSDSPLGVPGEMWIGGPGVTSGYLGLDELTSASFVRSAGQLMYRTGDLVDIDQTGTYRFHGRIDDQVKVRGHRVELEAIEAALLDDKQVHDAAVVLATRTINDRTQGVLVAHVVGATREGDIDETSTIEALRIALPEHMIPGALVVTDQLPRLPNGKLDRRTLEEFGVPQRSSVAKPSKSSAGDFEQQIVEDALAMGWCAALGIDSVDRHDDFYDLGGDSIVAIRIAAAVRSAGLSFTPRDIFTHSTIADLAPLVTRLGGPVEPRRSGPMPLTAIQRWFFAHDFEQPNLWNQGVWLSLTEPIPTSLLREALHAVVRHHEALSSVFTGSATSAKQIVGDDPVATPVFDSDFGDRSAAEATANKAINCGSGPLLAASVLTERRGHELFLSAHHLVVDAVSWSIIVEDLGSAISALQSRSRINLPRRQTSAGSWVEHLIDLPNVADSRLGSQERSSVTEGDTRTISTTLGQSETADLLAIGQPIDVSILAALNDAVRTSASTDMGGLIRDDGNLLVTVERHGREAASPLDLSLTVGWFTATAQLVIGPNQIDVINAIEAKTPQDLYDDRVVLGGGKPIMTDSIRFNHLGTTSGPLESLGPIASMRGPFGYIDPANARTHRLGVLSRVVDGRLEVSLDHTADDLSAEIVDAVARRLSELLRIPGWFKRNEQPTANRFELAGLDTEQMDDLANLLNSLDS